MKKTTVYFSIFFISMAFLSGCGNLSSDQDTANTADTQNVTPPDTTPLSDVGDYMFNYTIINLPAPVQVLEQYANAGLTFDVNLPNPYKNASNYQTAVSKAINFGIYGIDLAYLVVNKKSTDVYNYYSCARKLAQELNIAETFDKFTQRFENNPSDKDSLMRIIDDAYSSTHEYLRTNERLETASLILSGSWLESQYITVNLLKNTERTAENDTLFQRVWEQKFHLDNISKIFLELKGNEESLKIKADLDKLLLTYNELKDAQSVNKLFIGKLAANLDSVRKKIVK